ncbi:MAG: SDR family NAD(P)-dependent oxidoreductase [Pseudomonadota bacterium]
MPVSSLHAVISGGASGLGFAVAQSIIARGGKVALLDINAEQGAQAVAKLGANAQFFSCDISNAEQVDAAVDAAAQALGSVTVAVSCAGILGNGRVLGKKGPMEAAFFQKVININLIGAFLLTKAAARHMQHNVVADDEDRGVIIHTASIAAFEGQLGQAAYSASKAGVVGMLLPLAREFAALKIRVMAIAPGMFDTQMLGNVTDEIRAQLAASVPYPPRFGRPDEFSSLVNHIIDNGMFNGTVLRLDAAARLQ